MKSEAPCKDCEMRVVGCHSNCKLYQEFRENRDRELKENYQTKESLRYRRLGLERIVRKRQRNKR